MLLLVIFCLCLVLYGLKPERQQHFNREFRRQFSRVYIRIWVSHAYNPVHELPRYIVHCFWCYDTLDIGCEHSEFTRTNLTALAHEHRPYRPEVRRPWVRRELRANSETARAHHDSRTRQVSQQLPCRVLLKFYIIIPPGILDLNSSSTS